MDESERLVLASAVRRARLARGWGKEEAAREARVSSITWKRIEDGQRVQDAKMAAVVSALGLVDRDVDDAGREYALGVFRLAERIAADYTQQGGDAEQAAQLVRIAAQVRSQYDDEPASKSAWWQDVRPETKEQADGRDPAPIGAVKGAVDDPGERPDGTLAETAIPEQHPGPGRRARP